ncbi:hypothetical protein AVEN_134501-1 [Araneus ventricosus]|uniref:Uncharacterized protein n=1 Tax=Araneus ventricosus TaxID=182803 RepID=A0A4Y2UHA4_ARAVE|nr:hypothetical protein AVEN_134501-1 [Araneus ventricosus]
MKRPGKKAAGKTAGLRKNPLATLSGLRQQGLHQPEDLRETHLDFSTCPLRRRTDFIVSMKYMYNFYILLLTELLEGLLWLSLQAWFCELTVRYNPIVMGRAHKSKLSW